MAPSNGYTVWLTGLPGAGMRSLAASLATRIQQRGRQVEIIDSGRLRASPLGAGLGFSREDRDLNVRRHALAASLLTRHGVVAVVAAVSPHRATRDAIRAELGNFFEVHVATPAAVCIERDERGVWERALRGELPGFTGVESPYEEPQNPEATVDLGTQSLEEATDHLVAALEQAGLVPPAG